MSALLRSVSEGIGRNLVSSGPSELSVKRGACKERIDCLNNENYTEVCYVMLRLLCYVKCV